MRVVDNVIRSAATGPFALRGDSMYAASTAHN